MLAQVLGASSSAVDFVATHPYPVYGWDYLDYVAGRAPNLQVSALLRPSLCCSRSAFMASLCNCKSQLQSQNHLSSPLSMACSKE